MKILVMYATYSGGTEVVSGIISEKLQDTFEVTHKHIKETKPDELESFDVIIFGTPSWMVHKQDGQPHEFYFPFMESLQGKDFSSKKFAIFGLGDMAYTRFSHGVDVLEEFVKGIQGSLLIESLRIDGFFFNQITNEEKVKQWSRQLVEKLQENTK